MRDVPTLFLGVQRENSLLWTFWTTLTPGISGALQDDELSSAWIPVEEDSQSDPQRPQFLHLSSMEAAASALEGPWKMLSILFLSPPYPSSSILPLQSLTPTLMLGHGHLWGPTSWLAFLLRAQQAWLLTAFRRVRQPCQNPTLWVLVKLVSPGWIWIMSFNPHKPKETGSYFPILLREKQRQREVKWLSLSGSAKTGVYLCPNPKSMLITSVQKICCSWKLDLNPWPLSKCTVNVIPSPP
jgi:hypothetical protein